MCAPICPSVTGLRKCGSGQNVDGFDPVASRLCGSFATAVARCYDLCRIPRPEQFWAFRPQSERPARLLVARSAGHVLAGGSARDLMPICGTGG
jgi:hypothetical protein